ncbi:MAG: hypothetical protein WCS37_22515, partial [Chloroflexota bacterium]
RVRGISNPDWQHTRVGGISNPDWQHNRVGGISNPDWQHNRVRGISKSAGRPICNQISQRRGYSYGTTGN